MNHPPFYSLLGVSFEHYHDYEQMRNEYVTFYSLLGVSSRSCHLSRTASLAMQLSTPFWEFPANTMMIGISAENSPTTFYSLLGVSGNS